MRATFPYLALWQTVQFYMAGQSLEPQTSISGVDTVVPSLRGRWMASASFVLKGEAATLQWQAFLAQMEGRIGTTLVPAPMRFRPLDRNGKRLPFQDTAGFAGAQTFEHFGFVAGGIRRATVGAAAPARATQIEVQNLNTTGIRPGQRFSIGERLYVVQHHWELDGRQIVMFRPGLRSAVAAGDEIELGKPICRMRFVSENEGLIEQNMSVLPVATVSFVEVP